MNYRKIILRLLGLAIFAGFLTFFWYAWNAFPIISGYGAKNLCSAIYLQHRNPAAVMAEDLGEFPFTLGRYTINEKDSSVTGSVWGFARKKAIFRPGAGSTLVNDFPEAEIRAQHFERPVPPALNPDTISWPMGNKITDSMPGTIDRKAMDQALNRVFDETMKGNKTFTRAVIVLYNGQLVAEKYASGFGKNTVMLGWSVSKSLTGALIGILVKKGLLTIGSPAPVPEWRGTEKQKITVQQLLQQESGLDFNENYTGPSEVTNMLFKKGDMAAFTAGLGLRDQPGTVFNYSSGNSNILSRIIRQLVGEKEYPGFPYRELFYKTGMYSMQLEPDASGTYIGSSYSYATARDFARFGLLYYNDGKWGDDQLLPENWVRETVQPSGADHRRQYGYQFWLNGYAEKDTSKHQYPDVPADMYYADGYGGQDIYIIPSEKLVVVRLGLHVIDENKFLKEIISAVSGNRK